jgi:hypothetical protein
MENGEYQSCYAGGAGKGGACVTSYCTTTCGGTIPSTRFPIKANANDWHDFVTMQGAFQPTGGSHFSTAKDCSAIAAYRHNVVAWGGEYNVQTIIDDRVNRLNTFCQSQQNQVPATCPTGYTLSGNTCQKISTPQCPTGYQMTNGICTQIPTCSAGYILGPNNVCVLNPTCNDGYTLGGDKCTSNIRPICTDGYTYSAGVCTSLKTPICQEGYTLGPNKDVCTSIVTANCAAGHSLSGTLCVMNPNCEAGHTYTNGQCSHNVAPTCPTGYTFSNGSCNKNAAATTLSFDSLENTLGNIEDLENTLNNRL